MLEKKTGYIKQRFPKDLWNEAKSEAALLDITMTNFLMDATRAHILTCKKMREKKTATSMKQE
jgi:hypothetical protein